MARNGPGRICVADRPSFGGTIVRASRTASQMTEIRGGAVSR